MSTAEESLDNIPLCRLCMKSENVILMDIFNEDKNSSNEDAPIPLPLKIMACVDIEVEPDDSISNLMCHRCFYKVDSFYDFKERCKQVDVFFREKIRKHFLNVHLQDESSCGDGSEELQTEDEPTVLLVPMSGSSKHDNLKDPLALSDSECNSITLFERKPVHIIQEKKPSVKIDDVIRQQRENFNRTREVQKRQAEFLNLENTIKLQRETFKSKDQKDNEIQEAPKQQAELLNLENTTKLQRKTCKSKHKKGIQIQESQKRKEEYFNLENTIKLQREAYKKKKDNKSAEPVKATNKAVKVTKEEVKASARKTYCRLCHRSIPSEQFSKHSLSHQNKNTFQKYKRITHGGRKMYCCVLCAKIFMKKYSLQRHILLHQAKDILKAKKIHQCPVCSKSYTVSSSLKRHLILHTGERPFKCPICPRAFCDRSNLIKHERIHYPAKPFCCSICPAKFQFQNYLRKHLIQHLNERRMSYTPDHDCYTKKLRPDEQLAMMMSPKKAWFGKHRLSFSADTSSDEDISDTDNETVVAPESTERLQDDDLPSTSQQQEEQPEEDRTDVNTESSWRCRNCQTICPTYKQLVEHRKIHSGVSGYRCMVCKSLFQSQSALTRHVASSHFKCSTCDKAFMTKFICQSHEKEHKRTKPKNACGICDRIFLSIDALSKHMMKHNLQAPFKCVLCNSEFSSRTMLEMHFKECCKKMKQQAAPVKG